MYNLVQILKLKIDDCFVLSLHLPHWPAPCQVQRHRQILFCSARHNSHGLCAPGPPPCITNTSEWGCILSHSLQTPLGQLCTSSSFLLHWFAFKTDIYFSHCSYVLGFSQWRFLTRGPVHLGKTSSSFLNPDLRACLSLASPPPSLDTLTKPLSRTGVSKMFGSFMKIVRVIPFSPHCTLHCSAWFCISQKLFQVSFWN